MSTHTPDAEMQVRESYLRPNGLGGYIIRQSDLSSWSRCQLQKHYYDRARANPDAPQPEGLSATVFGTVVHLALFHYERALSEGREEADARRLAVATFEHYWSPEGMRQLGEKVTVWISRHTWNGLLERGRLMIRDYAELRAKDESWVIALEYQFAVPLVVGTGPDQVTHTLTGTVDRLSIRKYYRKPYLSLDDFKSGAQPRYLRYNMQGTAYAYASLRPEFWLGWQESGMGALEAFSDQDVRRLDEMLASFGYRLHQGSAGEFPTASRRFRWVNLAEVKFGDGGWRNARDYARLTLAVDAYVRANVAGIYGVVTDGVVCHFCAFNRTCGGVGLPDLEAGAP